MKIDKLSAMTKGWFVGDFSPVSLPSKDFEVAVKYYKAGDHESRHVHKIATEITCIAYGSVIMNGIELVTGDIVTIPPGESTDFHATADCCTVVVKTPSVTNDKYVL